jgi:hypothetical protein
MQEEASLLQCACGHAILCQVRCLGERLGTLAFFDNEPTSVRDAVRVESCPGCGEQLEFLRLWMENVRK